MALVVSQVPAAPDTAAARALPADPFALRLPGGSRIVLFDPGRGDESIRNLTSGFDAAGRPDVSFDAQRVLFVGRRNERDALNVWELTLATGQARQVTRRSEDCVEAVYLSSLFSRHTAEPVALICFVSRAGGVYSLHTCRLDGGDVRRITFDPFGAAAPRQLRDGRLLFSQRRAIQPSPRGPAAAPPGVPNSALMTIHIDGTDLSAYPDGFGAVDMETSRGLQAARSDKDRNAEYVLDMDGWDEISAVPVAPRPEPEGRSSVIDDRKEHGYLYCLDAYLTDDPLPSVGRGRIHTVRLVRADARADEPSPVLANGGSQPGAAVLQQASQPGGGVRQSVGQVVETVLGEAPVEADGSFYLQVPARTPLRLETLDERGGVLRAMTNWFWVMPNEARGCIGCHERPTRTPSNRLAQALRSPPHRLGLAQPEPPRPPDGPRSGSGPAPESNR